VEEVNRPLPPWQRIKRFAVLPRELTAEQGDVTPSLKLRRQVVTEQHRDLLDSLYDEPSVRATG
jgi:long-chain acyl-CoA synthetase